ncbi:MAG: pyridoxamine 5'-phosphate oxidase family protein [Opitutales bacterium]
MNQLPQEVLEAWEKRDPTCVLTTVSLNGTPNTIYVSCCGLVDGTRILICNSAFRKTLENLKSGPGLANFLFFAPGLAAYQLKGRIWHHSKGARFEEGKAFAKPELPLHGIAEIVITEAYKGAEPLRLELGS